MYPLPLIDLGPDTLLCMGQSAVMIGNIREPKATTGHYLWSTGDTTASLEVTQPGFYSLTLSTAPIGCHATAAITLQKDCFIDIPNAFTPNNDGVNDYFFLRALLSRNSTGFTMQVLNRWGQVVFETLNLKGRGWDGKFNGREQPQGAYIYRIEILFANNHQEQYEGHLTLIR